MSGGVFWRIEIANVGLSWPHRRRFSTSSSATSRAARPIGKARGRGCSRRPFPLAIHAARASPTSPAHPGPVPGLPYGVPYAGSPRAPGPPAARVAAIPKATHCHPVRRHGPPKIRKDQRSVPIHGGLGRPPGGGQKTTVSDCVETNETCGFKNH